MKSNFNRAAGPVVAVGLILTTLSACGAESTRNDTQDAGTSQDQSNFETMIVTNGITNEEATTTQIVCGTKWYGPHDAFQPLCDTKAVVEEYGRTESDDHIAFKAACRVVLTKCFREDDVTKVMQLPKDRQPFDEREEVMLDAKVDVRKEPNAVAGDSLCKLVVEANEEALVLIKDYDFFYSVSANV
jgi:hypothetical protein